MSKRKSSKSASSSSKRARTIGVIGAPNESDNSSPQDTFSSAALSKRTVGENIPTLATLAARCFATNLSRLYDPPESSDQVRRSLKLLPDNVASKLFDMLKQIQPQMLSSAFICAYFLRGESISLTGALTQVSKNTIHNLAQVRDSLRRLELSDLKDIPDTTIASLLPYLNQLESLTLRGCTKVGEKTVNAAAGCHQLTSVNLNYTNPSATSLLGLVTSLPHLQVLKLAGIPKLGSSFLVSLTSGTYNDTEDPLGSKLRNLKLRLITTPDLPLSTILPRLPNLESLDVSFTELRHLPAPSLLPESLSTTMQKLSFTSTPLPVAALPMFLAHFKKLRTVNLGALGGQDTPSLRDETLYELTDVLVECLDLAHVSLVGNAKLGTISQAPLRDFISRVGRRCQTLNLGSIPQLKSTVLQGLVPNEMEPQGNLVSSLTKLNLSNSGVDDSAVAYISTCSSLRTLTIASTKFSSEGVMEIIDGCTHLEELDLTACRGVKVTERRRFFEVWKEARNI